MKVKGFFKFFLVVVLLFAVTNPNYATGQKEKVERPNVIRFAIAEESRGLDPVFAHRRFSETAIHVHNSLVNMDWENNVYGGLAVSWEPNDDATEWLVKLRKDVYFHDGSHLTSKDVKAHFTRVFDPKYCCGNAYEYLASYIDTEIIDDYTFIIKFAKPRGPFSYYIAMLDVTGIPSNQGWEEKGKDMNLYPVGCGPFKFVEWVPQSYIKYERYDRYNWGSAMFDNRGAPHVEKLEVRFIADAATRVAALESGSVDIIKAPDFTDVKRLRDNPDFEIDRIPLTGMPFSFVFNTARWPTNDLNVRKAINLAINRERINIAAFLGEREPLYTTITPNTAHFWEGAKDLIYYAPDEAKNILRDAGYVDKNGDGIREKDGRPLKIDLYVFGQREANPSVITAEAIQNDLRAIGIDVNIFVRPWDDQSVIAMKGEHNMINFDMPLPTASILGVMFNSRETPREGHYGMGFTLFEKSNPSLSAKLDKILDAADNAPLYEDRDRYFVEAQKIIGNNYLGVPISTGFEIYVRNKDLKDLRYNSGRHVMFNDAYWDR